SPKRRRCWAFIAIRCSGKWWSIRLTASGPAASPSRARIRELFAVPAVHRRMPLVIFDLDGTLIDSRLDLLHAVNATRAQAGRGNLPSEQVFSFVGNGAPVLIKRAMGPDATDEEVERALEFFLDYYRHHALDYTVLYPGVREALDQLYAAGAQLAVLTNKPDRISRRIM